MELDDDGNIVSFNANGKYVPIPKDDVASMEKILNNLADANNDRKLWDKLATVTLEDKGFNDFYHKDSK